MATKTNRSQCTCQAFEFGEFDGGNEDAISYDTNCSETTARTFAQGHDAKLVGFLVRAELAGEEIRMVSGGVAISFPGAVNAAAKISDALALKAQMQLDAARARLAKKELAEARKAARKSAKKAAAPVAEVAPLAPIEARIKVGRWEYDAKIDRDTREATYVSKQGVSWTVAQDKYTVL